MNLIIWSSGHKQGQNLRLFYHMTKYFEIAYRGSKMLTLPWASVHNVIKICNLLLVHQFQYMA